jgi:hypothetical protein
MASPSTAAGAAIYKPSTLKLYDLVVLTISNTNAWRCPTTTTLLPFFTQNLSQNHLDIGVGTGYYLRQAIASGDITEASKITLADLNPSTLEAAQGELRAGAGVEATSLQCDIMSPLPLPSPGSEPLKFDSISLFYLLHCMPGPPAAKASIFSHLKNNLTAEGVLYGATILGKGEGVRHNWLGSCLMWVYNRMSVFGNVDDTEEDFVAALREHFVDVKSSVVGVVLLFKAQGVRGV